VCKDKCEYEQVCKLSVQKGKSRERNDV